MKLRLIPAEYDYLNDVQDIPRAFVPFLEIDSDSSNYLKWSCDYRCGKFFCKIESDVLGNAEDSLQISNENLSFYKKNTRRFIKNFLYEFLTEKLNKELPYGSLTGVRPTKLFYELLRTESNPQKYFVDNFFVLPDRAKLVADCVQNQKGIINSDEKAIAIFVNIPFCPTRCSYCSFISTEIGKVKKEIPLYVDCVVAELLALNRLIKEKGYTVSSIYIGGGTPASIGAENLGKILAPLKDYGVEFTVEAGRPDVICDELISVLSQNNVTRISVNPQTFKQSTLDLIGRKHSIEDIYVAFEKVCNKFDVNMDLIAGLPEETYEDFVNSLEKTLSLRPANITVHTLSLKRGSILTLEGKTKEADGMIKKMADFSISTITQNGYLPYYMYRQKNMADNLENVGYALKGKQCKYNIDMMEESITVIGSGAGAMSKLLSGSRIERLSNPKGFREYVDRINSIVEQKNKFFYK